MKHLIKIEISPHAATEAWEGWNLSVTWYDPMTATYSTEHRLFDRLGKAMAAASYKAGEAERTLYEKATKEQQ